MSWRAAVTAPFRNEGRIRAFVLRLASGPLLPALVAATLGLYEIGEKSLWLDEGFSVTVALLPTRELVPRILFGELHASPYYFALHPWTWLGTSEAAIRSMSVIFGVVGVVATYFVGKRYGVAFPAALILAVSPFLIELEQEARVYTMLVAGSALSTLLLLRLVERPGVLRAAAYGLLAALMIYLHPLGALVIAGHAIWLIATVPGRLRWRLAAVYPAVIVAWVPMFWFAATIGKNKIAWIRPTDIDLMLHSATELAGGTVLLGLVLVMLATGMRRDLPALWFFVPIVGTLLITFLIQPALQPRYVIAILPAAAVILARNRPVAVAVLIAVSLVGVGQWYVNGTKADWRGAGAYVASDVQPGDGIVFAPSYLRLVFGYYARVGDPLHAAVPWSRPDITGGPTDIAGIESRNRIWLVEGHGRELPDDVRAALGGFEVIEMRGFSADNAVSVSLLQRLE